MKVIKKFLGLGNIRSTVAEMASNLFDLENIQNLTIQVIL